MSDEGPLSPLCPLCETHGGRIMHQTAVLRVVEVEEASFGDYPGYLRVVLTRHVQEMTDLEPKEAEQVLHAVLACETAIRSTMQCDKINLASLGNQVPHLHWHVIPRFIDDAHFPGAVWSERVREVAASALEERRRRAEAIRESLRLAFQ
jgi:diadenosine tetraphosphate (Ap4A) HIT family hydrolase